VYALNVEFHFFNDPVICHTDHSDHKKLRAWMWLDACYKMYYV